ncbi:MAG: CdaR family protein [Syntrophotaleaceae bacterium]
MLKKFTENWVLKLLSLAFALVLWFFVMGEQRLERSYLVPLELMNMPVGMMVANDIPSRIEVRISGPRTLLMNLHPEDIGISVDLKGLRPGLTTFKRLEERLNLPGPLKVTRLSPSYIDVRLDRVITKSVPVKVRLAGNPAKGYRVVRAVSDPANATIEGAKSELEKVEMVLTDEVELEGATEDLKTAISLNYLGRYSHLKDRSNVEVRVDLERLPEPAPENRQEN